ncbi:MAG TPA: phosphopantetheine-binding protein [Thermoleophilaceae bacterium]|jgi:acyl carrier protein
MGAYLGQPSSSGSPAAAGVTLSSRVAALVLELSPRRATAAPDGALLVTDLGYESLALIELAAALEDEFGIGPIPADDALAVETIADVARLVARFAQGGGS